MRKLLTFISGGVMLFALYFTVSFAAPNQAQAEFGAKHYYKSCLFTSRTRCAGVGSFCNFRTRCNGTIKLAEVL